MYETGALVILLPWLGFFAMCVSGISTVVEGMKTLSCKEKEGDEGNVEDYSE